MGEWPVYPEMLCAVLGKSTAVADLLLSEFMGGLS